MQLRNTDLDIFINGSLFGHSSTDTLIPIPRRDSFFIPIKFVVNMQSLYKNALNTLLGKEVLLKGGNPTFTNTSAKTVRISWPLSTVNGALEMELTEKTVQIKLISKQALNWYLDLNTAASAKLPFTRIGAKQIDCSFEGMKYKLQAANGSFTKPANGAVVRMNPQMNIITLNLADIKAH